MDLADRYRSLLEVPGRLALDRSFVSELVYGPTLRGASRIDWTTATDLIRTVAERNGVFVHLTSPTSTITARLRARDEPRDPALIRRLAHAYRRVFAQIATLAPVITVNTGSGAQAPASAFPGDNQ